MIPNSISKEHILHAIEEINKDGIPEKRQSERYFLEYNDFLYPPKYVISIANRFANNKELDSKEFTGGEESNSFLQDRGFRLLNKPSVQPGQKWLIVTSQENWKVCLQNGVWGADENRANQMKNVKQGDEFLIYLIGMKIVAICKVLSDYYYEETNLWKNGIFPHRVRIEPVNIPKEPVDIKKLYETYFRYKGKSGGYFGQAIRPLPVNEFSIFQSEVARSMNELTEWNKSSSANNSITGEEEEQNDYSDRLRSYLETRFSIKIEKADRSSLKLPSGVIINARGSGNRSMKGNEELFWFGIDRHILESHLKYPDTYFALVLENSTRTYVFSRNEFSKFFENTQPGERPGKGTDRWLFTIQIKNEKALLRINRSNTSHNVDSSLNNWKQIPDFSEGHDVPTVFVTGYDEANLNHSIRYKTLGWRNQSHILSIGDYVFVYNKDSHQIQAAFNVVGKSDNKNPIWEEELKSETQKLEFPNRWNAEVLCDDLKIDLETINTFEPFNGNAVNKFIPLIGNNSPTPLSDGKYSRFRKFLVEQCEKSSEQLDKDDLQTTYWKVAPGENASNWQEQLGKGVVAIGWNELGDLVNRRIDAINEDIKKNWTDSYGSIVPQIKDFLSVKEGDIVIANKGISQVVGIGRVVGKYKHRPDLTFHHTYPVQWFDTTEREIPPQVGSWRRTISKVSPDLYHEVIGEISKNYLLIRHQPEFKRKKNERVYWSDKLGKEYHFGKNVVNYKKIQPGTKTIWFYTDKDKLYFLGYGEVNGVIPTPKDEYIATYANFNLFSENSPVEATQLVHSKIKSLDGWNPYNSIIHISEEVYNEIVTNPLQLETFDDAPLEFPSKSVIDRAIDKISQKLFVSSDVIMQILISVLSGRHVILAGPVGTGKTTLAKLVSQLFWEKDGYNGYYSEIYTATTEWSSYEVIGGMVPRIKNNLPTYEIVLGCVSETIINNWSKSQEHRVATIRDQKKFKGTWLVIDEFNRADIDKVFGQLFTSLETRILRVPVIEGPKIFEDVKIPLDYRIICTLNTADKHYLFKLSDALKRRFAYIELFPPTREEREKEIYYAIRNGLDELALDFSNLVVINYDTKIIDRDKSDKKMLSIIDKAYDIFDVIRMIKPLGTAILKSIYQSLLVGVKLTNDYEGSLDISINSNLIPQLESMSLTSLESIFFFLFRNPVKFFRDKHEGNDRDQYQNDFRNFLKFIHANKQEEWTKQFLEKIDDSVWNSVTNSYTQYKKEIKCSLFRSSLQDLLKVSLI
jgi:MoxR-like ATPase/predicted RNA-binding protein